MLILGIYVHVSARYEVSMSNAVTGTAVHRWQHHWWWWRQWWWQQHVTDKSWLHRLIGMYAKWAKKSENTDMLSNYLKISKGNFKHVTTIFRGSMFTTWDFCFRFQKRGLLLCIIDVSGTKIQPHSDLNEEPFPVHHLQCVECLFKKSN